MSEASALREATRDFFRDHRGVWELRVQLATDLATTPVEDASVTWPEDVTPQQTVATLTVEPQDSDAPQHAVYGDDVLSFNPWHCLVEHRPLRSIQRVRKPVYADSTKDRHERNARVAVEPDGIADIPETGPSRP